MGVCMSPQSLFLIFSGTAAIGLLVVFGLFNRISAISVDNEKAKKIAAAIQSGAMAFLEEEYRLISFAVAGTACLLAVLFSPLAAGIFVIGAIFSMLCGFLGMRAATMANVRTTMAAKNSGEHAAFLVAVLGGAVMGFAVASLGL